MAYCCLSTKKQRIKRISRQVFEINDLAFSVLDFLPVEQIQQLKKSRLLTKSCQKHLEKRQCHICKISKLICQGYKQMCFNKICDKSFSQNIYFKFNNNNNNNNNWRSFDLTCIPPQIKKNNTFECYGSLLSYLNDMCVKCTLKSDFRCSHCDKLFCDDHLVLCSCQKCEYYDNINFVCHPCSI